MLLRQICILSFWTLGLGVVQAHSPDSFMLKPILASLKNLEEAGIPALKSDVSTGVAYALIGPEQEMRLSEVVHASGACGGFEALPRILPSEGTELSRIFQGLSQQQLRSQRSIWSIDLVNREWIQAAVNQVSEDRLRSFVNWFSSYPTRYNRAPQANAPVHDLLQKIQTLLKSYQHPYTAETVEHTRTPQKSIRVRIEGSKFPNEVVVLGGHLDSISGFFGNGAAPGADDNASGSSNIFEALQVITSLQHRPERSIEFFWYAGEESGLLGSAEIAQRYKSERRQVVGVLQLDMTLFPGEGEFVISSIQDFTNAWLREYFLALNNTYIGVQVIESECGYGCSDHASWHRQGFPAIFPFEASFEKSNKAIHTPNDTSSLGNFKHSAKFAQIAVAFALDLANSRLKEAL